MDEEYMSTSVEQFLNHLIDMQLLSKVVVTDREGSSIIFCFGSLPPEEDINNIAEGDLRESNVVLSAARCFQNMEQLSIGSPRHISAQYRDALVVQSVEGNAILTLIGHRSKGHHVGDLFALLPQIRNNNSFKGLLDAIDKLQE